MIGPTDFAPRPLLTPLLSPRQTWLYRGYAAAWVAAALYFWVWWLQPDHIGNLGLYALGTLPLIWIYALQIYFLAVTLQARVSSAPQPVLGIYRVAMITTKTPAEPFAILQRTLTAMLAQDYPHDTWLADEDPTPEVLAWCAAHGVRVSTRRGREDYHRKTWPRRTRCKEGNLAFFYDHWGYRDYDIVAQLDADHVPQPGYLREMLRPFADPAVGYVTAPSICAANAKTSWAARTRLYAEAAFHGIFQAGYAGTLAPMCIGSHYAVRTQALHAVGGLGPELAEDHSTTMLMNAGGWRGVHAIDAIAVGDGPASVADLATQEFQWSRSLLMLLLAHTPRYLSRLPWRLKLLFVFCQVWYPLFAATMAVMYVLPILAITIDRRFADVTYPSFLAHSLPTIVVMTAFAYRIRRDGLLRPRQAPVIAWEKALFILLQWPWVIWGTTMALRDWITGRFVDFRITPKGEDAAGRLPGKVLAVYVALALGAVLPVLLIPGVTEARGFYLFAILSALAYAALLAVIIVQDQSRARPKRLRRWQDLGVQLGALALVSALIVEAGMLRGTEALHALSTGLQPLQLTREIYRVSGAGSSEKGEILFRFAPEWTGTGQ